jgi:hypothetical protein
MIQCQANASVNGDAPAAQRAIDSQAKVARYGMFRQGTFVALAFQTLPITQIYGADSL